MVFARRHDVDVIGRDDHLAGSRQRSALRDANHIGTPAMSASGLARNRVDASRAE